MRGYAALLTGAMAAMVSGLGMWAWTKMDILEIIFMMVVVYMVVPGIFMLTTEKRLKGKR